MRQCRWPERVRNRQRDRADRQQGPHLASRPIKRHQAEREENEEQVRHQREVGGHRQPAEQPSPPETLACVLDERRFDAVVEKKAHLGQRRGGGEIVGDRAEAERQSWQAMRIVHRQGRAQPVPSHPLVENELKAKERQGCDSDRRQDSCGARTRDAPQVGEHDEPERQDEAERIDGARDCCPAREDADRRRPADRVTAPPAQAAEGSQQQQQQHRRVRQRHHTKDSQALEREGEQDCQQGPDIVEQFRDDEVEHRHGRGGDQGGRHPGRQSRPNPGDVEKRRPGEIGGGVDRFDEDVERIEEIGQRVLGHPEPPAREHLRLEQLHELIVESGKEPAARTPGSHRQEDGDGNEDGAGGKVTR